MSKRKKDLLRKKLIQAQLERERLGFEQEIQKKPGFPGVLKQASAKGAVPIRGQSLDSAEYAYVFRDIKIIILITFLFSAVLFSLYFYDLKNPILTKFADFIFKILLR